MHILYNIGVFLLGIVMKSAALFHPKAKEWIIGRKNFFKELPSVKNKEVVWFHCASLGEFDQGLPLMEKIKLKKPNVFLLVTFYSPSGMNHYHKRNHSADYVCYLPLDTSSNANKFIQHFRPSQAYFIKYEFWSNYIFTAKKNGAMLFNISGIFREDHRFFKWYGSFFRKTLKQFDWFFVQNEKSSHLLQSIGLKNVSITGDNRYDRVIENKKKCPENQIISTFKNNQRLIIIGSSWPEDESIILPWILKNDVKVLIAPHNVDQKHIEQLKKNLPNAVQYSKALLADIQNTRVMILDTIGHLASAYKYGTIAYVGGGFSGSLHNILEPAVFGLPVLFGPKFDRFPEAQAFIDNGFGFSVSTTKEFVFTLDKIDKTYSEISEKEISFIQENTGASDKIILKINSISN